MMCFGLKDRKRVKTNHCVIVLLDDTQLVHELHHSTSGQDLLDVVIKHLNLLETSYFGLKYSGHQQHQSASAGPSNQQSYGYSSGGSVAGAQANATATRQRHNQMVWLDVNKSAIKQLSDIQPMIVYFAVKYYASDPCKLAEEITRYQFFLQCKQDLLHGRLPVPFDLAVELLALAVQSELGDFDPQRHADNYVGEFQLVPQQTGEMERRAALYHRQLTGQVPATAELNFLERIKWLDLYGCELHPIQYNDDDDDQDNGLGEGNQFAIGLSPTGVLVLRSRHKVAQYAWPRVVKTKCQGRCFLMDVIMEPTTTSASSALSGSSKTASAQRNRFGFRLRDKEASRRLRWSLEEHKSFFHLIHSSATLQQLASSAQKRHQQQCTLEREQQQLKFSQRFRNSIRSAIGFAGGAAPSDHFNQKLIMQHQQQLAAHQQQQQNQQQQNLLRSSVKSMNQSAARQQPKVVRMPSRRYNSNRSLARPQQQQHQTSFTHPQEVAPSYQANGLAPPQPQQQSHHSAHTMVDSQRQQALMMMNQFNQMNAPIARSQTLKPANSKEAKRNPYYQMMMMLTAQQHHAQMLQQQHSNGPEVSILPPGQHIVQPSIYRASSVVNGINQLGKKPADLILCQQQLHRMPRPPLSTATMGQQLFNGKPRYAHHQPGHESPRSTKSAMAPSSALKLASKKLAKQQQQLIYGNQADLLPLLTNKSSTCSNSNQRPIASYSSSVDYYGDDAIVLAKQHRPAPPPLPYSANASPRSTRSARLAPIKPHHRSKSTGENLHLLHKQQAQFVANNRMLLATAPTNQQQRQMVLDHQNGPSVPPPDYNLAEQHQQAPLPPKHRPAFVDSRRAALVMGSKQANLLLDNNATRWQQKQQQPGRQPVMSDDDDYFCSRSDCSSVDNSDQFRRRPELQKNTNATDQQARRAAGYFKGQQTVNANSLREDSIGANKHNTFLVSIQSPLSKSQEAIYGQNGDRQDWNSIKRRHDEFDSAKKGMLLRELDQSIGNDRDTNNNNRQLQYSPAGNNGLVKNIPNKQATPILLTMNYADKLQGHIDAANNKAAVKLLNLQRQQLNSQSSDGSCGTNKSNRTTTTTASHDGQLLSTSSSSASSSAVSSPKVQMGLARSNNSKNSASHLTAAVAGADSTGSNSTTSGYYAGSNSTGPTSVDSDTISGADSRSPLTSAGGQRNYDNSLDNWRQDQASGRANIAVGLHGTRSTDGGNRFIIGNPEKLLNSNQQKISINLQSNNKTKEREYQKQQQNFYLGETNNHSDDSSKSQSQQHPTTDRGNHRQHQWSPLEQIQQHSNSSLKYVSFDV